MNEELQNYVFSLTPGGHSKFPHPWPGQSPPLDSSGTAG